MAEIRREGHTIRIKVDGLVGICLEGTEGQTFIFVVIGTHTFVDKKR